MTNRQDATDAVDLASQLRQLAHTNSEAADTIELAAEDAMEEARDDANIARRAAALADELWEKALAARDAIN